MDQRGSGIVDEKGGWWLIFGGGLVALGSFLPWITFSGAGTFNRSGLDRGDGVITLVCGAVVGIIGGYIVSGRSVTTGIRAFLWSALIVAAVVWGLDFADIRGRVAAINWGFNEGFGSGVWVVAVGVVVAVFGSFTLPSGG